MSASRSSQCLWSWFFGPFYEIVTMFVSSHPNRALNLSQTLSQTLEVSFSCFLFAVICKEYARYYLFTYCTCLCIQHMNFKGGYFLGDVFFPAISVYSNIFFRSGGLHFFAQEAISYTWHVFFVFPRVSDVRSLSCTFLFFSGYRGHVSICFNHGSMLLLMAEILHQQGCKCIIAWKKKQETN